MIRGRRVAWCQRSGGRCTVLRGRRHDRSRESASLGCGSGPADGDVMCFVVGASLGFAELVGVALCFVVGAALGACESALLGRGAGPADGDGLYFVVGLLLGFTELVCVALCFVVGTELRRCKSASLGSGAGPVDGDGLCFVICLSLCFTEVVGVALCFAVDAGGHLRWPCQLLCRWWAWRCWRRGGCLGGPHQFFCCRCGRGRRHRWFQCPNHPVKTEPRLDTAGLVFVRLVGAHKARCSRFSFCLVGWCAQCTFVRADQAGAGGLVFSFTSKHDR